VDYIDYIRGVCLYRLDVKKRAYRLEYIIILLITKYLEEACLPRVKYISI
jgi:hypothetical protein